MNKSSYTDDASTLDKMSGIAKRGSLRLRAFQHNRSQLTLAATSFAALNLGLAAHSAVTGHPVATGIFSGAGGFMVISALRTVAFEVASRSMESITSKRPATVAAPQANGENPQAG